MQRKSKKGVSWTQSARNQKLITQAKENNQELLNRIEKLEQAIQDIWASCSCLRKDDVDDDLGEFNCEPPTCEDCGQFNCICGAGEDEEEWDHE